VRIFSILLAVMKNKLHYSFLFCLSVIGMLLALHFFPAFPIGNFTFRQVDLLADIREVGVEEKQRTDSLAAGTKTDQPSAQNSVKTKSDSLRRSGAFFCPDGITCLEDFSPDSSSMQHIMAALKTTEKTGKSTRIAFYGDSFIEGDVFCGSFRDSIQSIFGGQGVGFVPITSDVAGFRNTIKHKFGNWTTVSLVQKNPETDLGISGYTFLPEEGNSVEYKPSKQRYLREFSHIKLYFKAREDAMLHYTIDTLEESEPLAAYNRITEWRYAGKNISKVKFEFFPYEGVEVYGTSFESGGGVYVDNFSVRGNSGMNLSSISKNMIQEFNSFRNYKLVILQFGLNMVVEDKTNFEAYTTRMVAVINYLKVCFPQTSFLLLSVSDRSNNTTGQFKTMKAIPALRDAQRKIARKTGIAFWDMYQAMGGENSMVKFTEAKPPLGARDYTHLTFRGGKKLAGLLMKSLLFEKEKYKRKEIHEKGI
jgi:hypothetical protein